MRSAFALFFILASLSACDAASSGAKLDEEITIKHDERYVLASYGLPALSFDTAKACYQILKIGEEEIIQTPGIMGKVFGEHLVPFWRYIVQVGADSSSTNDSILFNGDFLTSSDKEEYELPAGLIQRSGACGKISGRAFVGAGLVNIGQIVEMEASEESVSFDSEQSLGIYIMGQAANDVSEKHDGMALTCVSALSSAQISGEEYTPDYVVWASVLYDKVNTGQLDPTLFSENNSAFRELITVKGDEASASSLLGILPRSKCVEISTQAMDTVRAEID